VEFSYLVVVAAELGVADRLASGPRSIADLSAATGADAQSLSTGSCAATTGGDDGRRLLSLLGWLHLIREGHRLKRDVKQPQARLAAHLRSQQRQSKESHYVYLNEETVAVKAGLMATVDV
jgi:hypothetical protein